MKFTVFAFFFGIISTAVHIGFAQEHNAYHQQLKRNALEKGLSSARYWHILLDYEKTLTGSFQSRIDFPGSFLAPNGKNDPKAELLATIDAFFWDADYTDSITQLHPQCQFIARLNWLQRELAIDVSKLPKVTCERYREWRRSLSVDKVYMVFPAADISQPASMFGHTLLRIENSNRKEGSLLSYGVNYAANVDLAETSPVEYAFLGVFGGYDGYFSLVPYHQKVQEYNETDQRDIWEFALNFSAEEIDRLMMRLWEVRLTSYDYFFFKENCSFNLLSLLEAARPELELNDDFVFWAIPIDTIRTLTRYPGLIGEIRYRPSRYARAVTAVEGLSKYELAAFDQAVENPDAFEASPEIISLSDPEKVNVLDVLMDYYLIQNNPASREHWRKAALARSRIKLKAPLPAHQETPTGPLQIHQSGKINVSIGTDNTQGFTGLTYRGAYHDLFDSTRGLGSKASFLRVEFLTMEFRNYEDDHLLIDHVTFIGIGNLKPVDRFSRAFSYNIDFLLDSNKHKGCLECLRFRLRGDIGRAWSIAGVQTMISGGGDLREIPESGFQTEKNIYLRTGLYYFLTDWNVVFQYEHFRDIEDGTNLSDSLSGGFSYHPSTNSEVGFRFETYDHFGEYQATIGHYF